MAHLFRRTHRDWICRVSLCCWFFWSIYKTTKEQWFLPASSWTAAGGSVEQMNLLTDFLSLRLWNCNERHDLQINFHYCKDHYWSLLFIHERINYLVRIDGGSSVQRSISLSWKTHSSSLGILAPLWTLSSHHNCSFSPWCVSVFVLLGKLHFLWLVKRELLITGLAQLQDGTVLESWALLILSDVRNWASWMWECEQTWFLKKSVYRRHFTKCIQFMTVSEVHVKFPQIYNSVIKCRH